MEHPSDAAGRRFAVRVKRVAGLPVVAARIWLRGGMRMEEIPGQAYVAGRLLVEGSRRRSWDEIALQAEERGMAVHGTGYAEAMTVSIDALAEDTDLALAWLAELALDPAFPAERCDWIRRQAKAELESMNDRPDVRTARAFLEQLYHPHPYCRPLQGDASSLDRLTPEDCAAFHRRSLAWGGCLVVTGDVDEDAVAVRLEELFGAAAEAAALPGPAAARGLEMRHREVTLASAEQAYLYAGHLTVPRNHPQLVALEVAGVVLGAGPGLVGRLPTRIREREGLAYGVHVATASGAGLDAGRLVVRVGTSAETVARAEDGVRDELRRLVEDGVGDDELEEARSFLIGRDPFRRETARQWADLLAEAELYGLPTDRPEWVVGELRALTREDVEAAARRWIRPEELRVTVGLPADGVRMP